MLVISAVFRIGDTSETGDLLALKHEYFWDRNKVWNHTPAFLFRQEFDVVTGASRRLGTGVGQQMDGVSSASKIEFRHSENPSVTFENAGVVATVGFYNSRENDYFSYGPSGSLAWDFNERNTTVGFSHAQFFDKLTPRAPFSGQGGKKRIQSSSFSLTQILTPLTLVSGTISFLNSYGFLGHPYTPPIDSNGNMVQEKVPDHKQGAALSGQIIQGYHLGPLLGSINIDARWYQDEWDLKSGTADFHLHQNLWDGTIVEFRGRIYRQSGTFFAKEYYTGTETYRSADIRWYPFTSRLIGAKLSSIFFESWGESLWLPDRWNVKYDYLLRDTHGDTRNVSSTEPRHTLYQLYDSSVEYAQGVMMIGLEFDL
jgi:hypothetical protein